MDMYTHIYIYPVRWREPAADTWNERSDERVCAPVGVMAGLVGTMATGNQGSWEPGLLGSTQTLTGDLVMEPPVYQPSEGVRRSLRVHGVIQRGRR